MMRFFITIISVFLSIGLTAQITLQGRVIEKSSGEPLPFVNVSIKEQPNLGAVTNVDGYFSILNIPSKNSTLQISYIGYGTTNFPLTGRDLLGIEIFEIKKSAIELKTFEVTDFSNPTIEVPEEVSKISINPDQLLSLPSLGEVDVFRSLQLLPGVSGATESSSGLYVRGGTPDQNLVLLDGINIYHVDHFFGVFSPFNAFAIKNIQFYKGGFPAEFGGRLSSVVDITAKSGNAKKLTGSVNANLLSVNGVIESPLPKKWGSLLIAGRRSYTDIIQSPTYNSIFNNVTEQDQEDPTGFGIGGINQVDPTFFFYDLNGKLTLTPSDRDVITLSYFSSRDDLDNSSSTDFGQFIGGNSRLETTDITLWGNDGYSAKWSRQFTPKLYGRALLSYSNYSSNYELTNGFYNTDSLGNDSLLFQLKTVQENDVQDAAFRYDLAYQINDKHTVKGGMWYTYNEINYLNVLDDTINLQDRFETGNTYAFYAQHKANWDKLTLEYGLRGTYFTPNERAYFEPRLSFIYRVMPNIRLKGAWGIYRQFMNRVILENVFGGSRDFWLLSDGNTIPVSLSQHYILGAAFENKNWLIDVEAYRKNMSGLLEYSLRFGGFSADLENNDLFFQGTGVVNGIDFLLQRKFGAFTGWLGYTLSKVDYTFPDINQGRTFPALQDQRHEAKLVAMYKLGDFDFGANFIYATGKPYTAPVGLYNVTVLDGTEREFIHFGDKNSQRLPDYHRLGFSITYNYQLTFVEGKAGVSFFNVYNRDNIRYKRFFLREFDPDTFQPIKPEVVETDVTLLGFVPNIFLSLTF